MPLYEIVLRDGDDEVRLTDRQPHIGDRITMLGRDWTVRAMDGATQNADAAERYICTKSDADAA